MSGSEIRKHPACVIRTLKRAVLHGLSRLQFAYTMCVITPCVEALTSALMENLCGQADILKGAKISTFVVILGLFDQIERVLDIYILPNIP